MPIQTGSGCTTVPRLPSIFGDCTGPSSGFFSGGHGGISGGNVPLDSGAVPMIPVLLPGSQMWGLATASPLAALDASGRDWLDMQLQQATATLEAGAHSGRLSGGQRPQQTPTTTQRTRGGSRLRTETRAMGEEEGGVAVGLVPPGFWTGDGPQAVYGSAGRPSRSRQYQERETSESGESRSESSSYYQVIWLWR